MRERFIYLHRRPDTGACFYVGKGTKNPRARLFRQLYERAFSVRNRNPDWHEIVRQCGFNVEIVQEGLHDDLVSSEAEKRWVAECSKLGALVNRTIGGCGVSGYRFPAEIVERLSSQRRGRRGALCKNSKPVYVYKADTGDYIGHFGSAELAGESVPVDRAAIGYALRRSNNHACGYLFYRSHQGERVAPLTNPPQLNGPKPVSCYDSSFVLKVSYESVAEAARLTRIPDMCISRCCRGQQRTAGGLYWRYHEDGPLLPEHVKPRVPRSRRGTRIGR